MSGIATLPIENPVLIFFIVLVIILFAPILLNRIRVPHIIGLIISGVIIGPNGLNLLARDSSFEIFGNVGILYLMFLAGLEIDMYDFKKSKKDGIIFGLYTFLIPMILGTAISYYTLHLNLMTSILLASMYASHTLIAYPIISRYGISRSRLGSLDYFSCNFWYGTRRLDRIFLAQTIGEHNDLQHSHTIHLSPAHPMVFQDLQ